MRRITKVNVRKASNRIEIQTGYDPNTNQELYRYNNLLGKAVYVCSEGRT
jgi:hypothetical protein